MSECMCPCLPHGSLVTWMGHPRRNPCGTGSADPGGHEDSCTVGRHEDSEAPHAEVRRSDNGDVAHLETWHHCHRYIDGYSRETWRRVGVITICLGWFVSRQF